MLRCPTENNGNKPSKIAKRNAIFTLDSTHEDMKKIEETIGMLNWEIYEEISGIIENNPYADLMSIIEKYTVKVGDLKTNKKIPYFWSPIYKLENRFIKSEYPHYFKTKCSKDKEYTRSYLDLASVLKLNPLFDKNDSLMDLLNQAFENDNILEKKEFKYINIKDVIKSKGNAIHGPRREDIGTFNRKLFESHIKELEPIYQDKLLINIDFEKEMYSDQHNENILSTALVDTYIFDGQIIRQLKDCLLIIHTYKNKDLYWSLESSGDNTFTRIKLGTFLAAMSLLKPKKCINLLHLPTFRLTSFDFKCEHTCKYVFDNFFKISIPLDEK